MRHGARNDDVKSMLRIEIARCRADEHTCRHRVYFLYEPLRRCVRRPSRRSSAPPSSLCPPVPFLSHIHDVIATPTTVTRSHFDPRRSISVFRLLFLRFSPFSLSLSFSLALTPFPFHSSRLHSCSLCRRKNRESGRGRYTSVPIHTMPSRPPLRGSAAHTWIGAYVRKDCEKAREREKGVCEKAKSETREKKREIFQQ